MLPWSRMLKTGSSYLINPAKIISETIAGETIIINLENGHYFSLNASASLLWELLLSGATIASIVARLQTEYSTDLPVIEASLETSLAFFRENGLVTENESPNSTQTPPAAPTTIKQPFVAFAITRYDDMQEMLLADPIHDVDQAGWPHLKPELKA